jgi:hypothetical protein
VGGADTLAQSLHGALRFISPSHVFEVLFESLSRNQCVSRAASLAVPCTPSLRPNAPVVGLTV